MKSKKHLKRRKISKQKTFQFERNGKRFKIKGLTAQSALSKLLRSRVSIHQSEVNIFSKGVDKLKVNISELNTSLSSYIMSASKLRAILNFIMRIFGFKTAIDIQKEAITKQSNVFDTKRKEKIELEFNRPYLNEFKICF